MSELHDLTALEQAAAVRSGETSAVALLEHALARVERLSATLGAFVHVTHEAARTQARAADARVADARRTGAPLPPLLGVPTAVKDLHAVAGVPMSLGSAAYEGFVPTSDDHVVERMREAGTVSLGKTTTPELGLPCYTEPDVAPPARTPWDPERSAGGSSGGAAAAVAGGLVPVAQGSDGGGSLRIPASVCGLVGLKPTRGRVSTGPTVGNAVGLLSLGGLARTVRDAAAFLDAVAGPVVGDPTWAPPPDEPFLTSCERSPGRLRVGRYRTPVLAETDVDPACVAAYEEASALLDDLGHSVEDVAPPFGPEVLPVFETVWAVSALTVPVDPSREVLLRPLTRWLRDRGRACTAEEYARAVAALQSTARAAVRGTDAYDVVLTPTLASPPVPVGALRDDADPAGDFAAQTRFTPWTAAYNVTGQPAVSLPLHWTAEGLPIGIMLVGRPADEATLLRLSAQLEEARPWAARRPPVW